MPMTDSLNMRHTLMTARRASIALALPLIVLLTGCSQWRTNLGTPLTVASAPGQGTSLQSVLDNLGPPLYLASTPLGYVMAWEYRSVSKNKLGLSLGFLGADFLQADWGLMTTSGQYLVLGFDRDHTLQVHAWEAWDKSGGRGQGVQPFAEIIPVVRSEDLVDYLPQHRWGAQMLRELPVGLNRGSDPNTGENGLQRRGAPKNTGQRALEMH